MSFLKNFLDYLNHFLKNQRYTKSKQIFVTQNCNNFCLESEGNFLNCDVWNLFEWVGDVACTQEHIFNMKIFVGKGRECIKTLLLCFIVLSTICRSWIHLEGKNFSKTLRSDGQIRSILQTHSFIRL